MEKGKPNFRRNEIHPKIFRLEVMRDKKHEGNRLGSIEPSRDCGESSRFDRIVEMTRSVDREVDPDCRRAEF